MNKNRLIAILLISVFMIFSGCSSQSAKSDKEQKDSGLSDSEKDQATIAVGKYFEKLYGIDVDTCVGAFEKGEVPSDIQPMVSEKTIGLSANSDIPLHYPRYVQINGKDIVNYTVSKSMGNPEIIVAYMGKVADKQTFFAKVNLKAQYLTDKEFEEKFKRTSIGNYVKKETDTQLDNSSLDELKIQARYDIQVVKEGNQFKILSAKETGVNLPANKRLSKLNNQFLSRIAYFNIKDSEEGLIKADTEDKKSFDNDKKLIENFLKSVCKIDSDGMNLLKNSYQKSKEDFTAYLDKLGVETAPLSIDGDKYKTKMDYDSFPLRFNMLSIKDITGMDVSIHPGFSKNLHKYIVKFDSSAEMRNGILNDFEKHKYDYTICIKDSKISEMYLNEVYRDIPVVKESASPKTGASPKASASPSAKK